MKSKPDYLICGFSVKTIEQLIAAYSKLFLMTEEIKYGLTLDSLLMCLNNGYNH